MVEEIEGKIYKVVDDFFKNYIDVRCDNTMLLLIIEVLTKRIMEVVKND